MRIKVRKDYLDYIPRPTSDQYRRIYESIKEKGQKEEIIINQHGVIIDGHTRYNICKKLGRVPKYRVKQFKDTAEELQFARITNIERRHLTPMQSYELVEKFKAEIAAQVKEDGKKWVKEHGSAFTDRNKRKEVQTTGRLGKMVNLSSNTIEKLSVIKKYGTKSTISKVRRGELNIGTGYAQVRKERMARGDKKLLKMSTAVLKGVKRKKLSNIHNSMIGITINSLKKIIEGETLITTVALLVDQKYDRIVTITDRLLKHKYITQRFDGKKNYLSITPKGRKFYRQLVKIEVISKECGVIDWL